MAPQACMEKWILRCAIAHHSARFTRPGMTEEDGRAMTPDCCLICERRNLARGHARADFGAQFVDQPKTLFGLHVPEGPAVAGAGALRHCADAVDRADLVAEHDGAVGADQRAVAFLGIDEP